MQVLSWITLGENVVCSRAVPLHSLVQHWEQLPKFCLSSKPVGSYLVLELYYRLFLHPSMLLSKEHREVKFLFQIVS